MSLLELSQHDRMHAGERPVPLGVMTTLLLLAQLGFGAMTVIGSFIELATSLGLIVLPAAAGELLHRMHDPPFVGVWVIVANAVSLPLGAGLAGSAASFLATGKGARCAARCAAGLAAVFLVGQLVMIAFVYPLLPIFALVPAVMGTVGSLLFATFLWRYWTRRLRAID